MICSGSITAHNSRAWQERSEAQGERARTLATASSISLACV